MNGSINITLDACQRYNSREMGSWKKFEGLEKIFKDLVGTLSLDLKAMQNVEQNLMLKGASVLANWRFENLSHIRCWDISNVSGLNDLILWHIYFSILNISYWCKEKREEKWILLIDHCIFAGCSYIQQQELVWKVFRICLGKCPNLHTTRTVHITVSKQAIGHIWSGRGQAHCEAFLYR